MVHLFEKNYNECKDVYAAFTQTICALEGSFALLLLTPFASDEIFFAKKNSPLELAIEGDEIFFASSDAPLIGFAQKAYYLDDGVYGWVSARGVQFFKDAKPYEQAQKPIASSALSAQKEGFRFFMEKEIYEQQKVLIDALSGRLQDERVEFEELDSAFLDGISSISICACGTSFHAGLTAQYLFGRLARMRVSVEIASEFRYKDPIIDKNELFIVISQSGETADTLEALKIASANGAKTLAICNVDNSSIVRLADRSILTRAGIEKGVASTKAFSAQTIVLWALAVFFAQNKMQKNFPNELKALRQAHEAIAVREEIVNKTHRLSKRYLHGHGFFFIGRDLFYPLALEGALKLKEISYLHAEGYPAGEMKHGPIALVDKDLFTIALLPSKHLNAKMRSNIEELSARDSTICVISPEPIDASDDFVRIQSYEHPMNEFFASLVALQLLAMEISLRLGNDIDMPRNLAKSVTVE
ncbi:MAG: glutamine--fructose-6-phosphate transaminase (isomerizing) [Deltaproteobacteria bacterium]|nr:MAG: glutamine--fructose-6-phosphate transaminase (isomerizing) [Deltaproteobacteria bacterium]